MGMQVTMEKRTTHWFRKARTNRMFPKTTRGSSEYYKNAIEKSGGKVRCTTDSATSLGFQDGKLNKTGATNTTTPSR